MTAPLAGGPARVAFAVALLALTATVALLSSLPALLGAGWLLFAEENADHLVPGRALASWVELGIGFAPWVTLVVLPFALRRAGEGWGAAFLGTAATLVVLTLAQLLAFALTFGGV